METRGCNPDRCPPWNLGTATKFIWDHHATWGLDYPALGMDRYEWYYVVPCLSLFVTFFTPKGETSSEFRGEIRRDDYGRRSAHLYYIGTLPETLIWEAHYDPGECGAEPFDGLWRQHAIASGNLAATQGREVWT